jgi:FkbM family methyltransferase
MDLSKKIWFSAFARRRFRKFNDRLLRRGLVGLGVNDYGPRQERGERRLLERLVHILPQRAIVCDVGAHDGFYTHFLASLRPDLIIHAFEPNPISYARLAETTKGHFTIHQFALGDKEGEATLHDPNEAGGGSGCASLIGDVMHELYDNAPHQKVSVQVKRLDHTAETLQLPRIDYLKIDAEGYDLMVLRGASRLIEENRLGVVQFEFNTMNVFSRSFMYDFYKALPQHRLYRIVQDGLILLGERYNPLTWELFGFQNIVAVPKDMENTLTR